MREQIEEMDKLVDWIVRSEWSAEVQRVGSTISSQIETILDDFVNRTWVILNCPSDIQQPICRVVRTTTVKSTFELFEVLKLGKSKVLFQLKNHLSQQLLNLEYISIRELVRRARSGDWRSTEMGYRLISRREPESIRFVNDLDFAQQRSSGATLGKIAQTFGLTRERVRQRVNALELTGVEFSFIGQRKEVRETSATAISDRCITILKDNPGATLEDLCAQTGLPASQIRSALPTQALKFLVPVRRKSSLQWSDEDILKAIRLAATYQYPLSRVTYDELVSLGQINCCTGIRVLQRFGMWSTACEHAGIESILPIRSTYERHWTDNNLIECVVEYLLDANTTGTLRDYSGWTKVQDYATPSVGTLRLYLGSWKECLELAMNMMGTAKYYQRFRNLVDEIVKFR